MRMAEIVRMPKLSDTMTEGVVAEWHKKVGDTVESGELLAEIETDKATMEFESFQDGVLLHIGVEKGKAAPIDSILAILGEKGEDIKPLLEAEAKSAKAAPVEDTSTGTSTTLSDHSATEEVAAPAPVAEKAESAPSAPAPVAASAPASAPVHTPSSNGRMKASPFAKKLAEEKALT